MTLALTWHQPYPGGRIVAKLGDIEVGAVFPDEKGASWSFWLKCRFSDIKPAKSVNAAQNALLSATADWLREAGLQQVQHA